MKTLLLFLFLLNFQKGFTQFSSRVTPGELVAFLNDMYQRFDDIAAVMGIFKVEIIVRNCSLFRSILFIRVAFETYFCFKYCLLSVK